VLLVALAVMITGVLVAGVFAPYVAGVGLIARFEADRFLNTRCDVVESPAPLTSHLYARDGTTLIASLFVQNRSPVALSQVPPIVEQALVATEDRRFYSHHGVDLRGLIRAAVNNVRGGGTQGGSTLTMQYVKQLRYYQARTDAERQAAVQPDVDRKIRDAQCALDLEKTTSKAQILQKYLNIAFFGENSYGIAVAAQTYFAVPVSKLTVPQSALLIGLLQAPSLFDPFIDPRAARARRDVVIDNLADVGDISQAQATAYAATPLRIAGQRPPPVRNGCSYTNPAVVNAGFFCDYAVRWLQEHGLSAQLLDTTGLRIITTLDAGLQASGQRAVWTAGLRPDSDYILVMPSVDPRTGDVTTAITSRRYGISSADKAVSSDFLFSTAYAGAGSTYKYFTALAALTGGAPPTFTLSTPGNTYTTRNCASGDFKVHNAGNYPATLPLSQALPQSSNTYFVAMEDLFFGCNLSAVVHTALNLGMNRLTQPLNGSALGPIAGEVIRSEEPTFTLGEEPTSPLELTGAFAAAANDGVFCPPAPIRNVYAADGTAVPVNRPPCRRELSPYVARTIMTMMRADTHTGTAAGYFGGWYADGASDVAGKTGTDNNATDDANAALWFVGMTPGLVSAASLVNPIRPKQTVHDLPNLPGVNVGQDIFGAYAATYWLAAYGPRLRASRWAWPDVHDLPATVPVPDVVGKSVEVATSTLNRAGFQQSVFAVPCGSAVRRGDVAYQQPPVAQRGSMITVCLSSGTAPTGAASPNPPARR
jgi:membrane peptidoglycan carboxypeptidase